MGLEQKHVEDVCKIKQVGCCSYLMAGPDGFECAKANPGMKRLIDERRAQGTMNAKGDNCSGYPDFTPTPVKE